jgi:CheY-like chemotaxis protein
MSKILIVDDEAAIRRNLKRFLTLEGHDVVEAGDGLEALAAMNDVRVDVAFVDIVMPTVDGITLMRRLLQDHPGVRIIVMSGYDDVIDLPAREFGIIPSLKKPFTVDEAKAVFEAVLWGEGDGGRAGAAGL